MKQAAARELLLSYSSYPSVPEDGGDIFLRNVYWLPTDKTALYLRRYTNSSYRSLFTKSLPEVTFARKK
jgi:hypothetical protein